MLDELRNIDGEHVINIIFGQLSDSEGSDSEGSDSENKGSTVLDLEESTSSQVSSRVASGQPAPRNGLIRQPFKPTPLDLQQRSTAEVPVEDFEAIPQKPSTALERHIMATLGIKKLAKTYRYQLDRRVFWADKYGKKESHEAPSPNDLWDTNPAFQTFVKGPLYLFAQQKGLVTAKGLVTRCVCAPGNYQWFFEGNKPGEGQAATRDPNVPDFPPGYDLGLHKESDDE